MADLEAILYKNPWITYNDTIFHSRVVLTFPKNMIFAAQFLSHVLSLPVYRRYPYAERFDVYLLQNVDWKHTLIVLDHASRVLLALDPVLQLIQLERRLQYQQAANIFLVHFKYYLLPYSNTNGCGFWEFY
ncbi:hypothetical protein AVEN_257703-1 [Araneus ventricosus]|uniref:Uncharacterized protein n=1 Tax=Araneus ventricosus TaxID=182803 RepID=A0A4Y2LEZ8_ARAVE|nr:hypothetical protein AVEN_257703-1 [Araneus ventricosus]